MKKITTSVGALTIVMMSYGQNDSITISKSQFNEIYSFLESSIKWIEKEKNNSVELDYQCNWIWKLKDELEIIKQK